MFETHAIQIGRGTFLVEITEIRSRRVCTNPVKNEECATASPSKICPKCGEVKRNEKINWEFKITKNGNGFIIDPPLTPEQYNRPANFLEKIRVAIGSEHAYEEVLDRYGW